MDDIIKAVILGIVEGITEFLPISSTGHLILVNQWVNFADQAFSNMFNIVIQLGAILSVVVYFRKKLFPFYAFQTPEQKHQVFDLWGKSLIGIIPALVLGFLFDNLIEKYLFNAVTVAISLIVWGIVIIVVESQKRKSIKFSSAVEITYMTVIFIGLIQCIAMVPGTSRSAATIIGAMMLGASRVAAAEFSFFLAIPTMCAASGYALLKYLTAHHGPLSGTAMISLAVGFAVSFIVALLVIAGLMKFISKNDFRPFGVYRILLGTGVLAYFLITGVTAVK